MRLLIVLLIIVGLVLFFRDGADNESTEDSFDSVTQNEDSGSESSSIGKSEEDDLFSELRKTLPIIESENEMVRIAALSESESAGICPNPAADVLERENEWVTQQVREGKDFIGPLRLPDKLVRFGSGMAEFPKLEASDISSLITARNMLLDIAILEAKAAIIEEMNKEMSADSYTDFPQSGMAPTQAIYEKGQDLRQKKKEARAEIESINEELERVSEAVIRADEDEMAGVGIVDRLGAFVDAATIKLSENSKREDISEEEIRQVQRLKARLQDLKNRKQTLETELQELDSEMLPYAQAVVNKTTAQKLAYQTLYGTRIVKQWFCFNAENRSAALNVKLVWSTKLHEEAEAILRRQPVELEPTDPEKSWKLHMLEMDKSKPTVGRYIEPDGNLIWYTVRHKDQRVGNTPAQRQALKTLTEGRLLLSLYSEVATQNQASEALITAQDGGNSFTTEEFMGRMQESAKNISIPGTGGYPGIVENPMNGDDMLYHVAWFDPKAAANSQKIIQQIEATNFRFHKDQSYWKGLIAGMQAAGASTKDDPEAARKGFNEGASGVFSEAAEDPLNQAGDETVRKEKIGLEKSGRWESEASDDF